MLFNCLHLGHGKPNVSYKTGNADRDTTRKEKDLVVTLSADIKVSD